MAPRSAKKRKLWVGGVILFWLSVGVAAPFIFNISGDELLLDNAGVFAAPRDSIHITNLIRLDKSGISTVSSGTLALLSSAKDKQLSAEKSAALLKSGDGVLLLTNSSISLGTNDSLSAPASGIASTEVNGSIVSAPLVQALQDGKFKALVLRDSALIVALPDGHRERLTKTSARIVPGSNGTIEAKGDGFWRGQRSSFVLTSNGPAKDGRFPVKLTFKATLLEFTYDGTIELQGGHVVRGNASFHLKNVEKLANALGTSWPISTNLQDVRVEGPLHWENRTLAFDQAQVSVDGNTALGTVSLNSTAGQSLISSTLAFRQLDISQYLPTASTDHATLAWHWWSKLVATLSQPAAPHINADIRISTKTLTSGEHKLGPAAATISMRNGKLSADIAEITLDSSRATGQVSVDFNRYIPKLTVRGQIEDIATSKWSEAFAGKRLIEGKGRLTADLAAQGVTLEQILGEISGKVEFAMNDGGIVGISLGELSVPRDTPKAESNSEIIARALKGATQMTGLQATWVIKDGVATILHAKAVHPAGEVKASGNFDLVRHSSDFRLLSLVGVTKQSGAQTRAAAASSQPTPVRAPPPSAALLSMKSNLVGSHSGLDFKLHHLTGTLKELEKFLSADYANVPRRGL